MHDRWIHVGRLWTNGEPFLAVDAAFRDAWQGFSNDEFGQVVGLGPQHTSIPVGAGRGVVVGGDAVVRDDSWIEVFEAASGRVAFVQASGLDYPDVLARALDYPDAGDEDGDTLKVSSGELAIFSTALDGAGTHSVPLLTAQPGPLPPVHGPPTREMDPGLLFSTVHTAYKAQGSLVHRARRRQLLRTVAPHSSTGQQLSDDPGGNPREPRHERALRRLLGNG